MNRLPGRVGRRAIHTHRYEKQVPGHHVQVDVTFLTLVTKRGKSVRRFQYTAIDDATRIRALKIYTRHAQQNAIDFMDYVIEKFPFRINMVRTDRGIEHAYIKPRTPCCPKTRAARMSNLSGSSKADGSWLPEPYSGITADPFLILTPCQVTSSRA